MAAMPAPAIPRATAAAKAARVLRILFVISGGYVVTSAVIGALSVTLVAIGMAASEAAMLTVMLAVPGYVAVLVWGFAARRPGRPGRLAVGWAALAVLGAGVVRLAGG